MIYDKIFDRKYDMVYDINEIQRLAFEPAVGRRKS